MQKSIKKSYNKHSCVHHPALKPNITNTIEDPQCLSPVLHSLYPFLRENRCSELRWLISTYYFLLICFSAQGFSYSSATCFLHPC